MPQICGAIAIAVGVLVLAGWLFDIALLKTLLPGFVTMKANTAMAFMLSGTSLLLLAPKLASPDRKRAGRLLALLVALIGVLTLGEEFLGWQPGIDELLFRDSDAVRVFTSAPGRMAVTSAVAFLLLGLALLTIDLQPWRRISVPEILVLLTVVPSLVSLARYAADLTLVIPTADTTRMAVHTVMTFLVLCIGVLAARSHGGILSAIRAQLTGLTETWVYVTLAFGLVTLLFVGAAAYYSARDSVARSAMVDHTHAVRRQLLLVLSTHQDVQLGSRGYVITGNPEFLGPFQEGRRNAESVFNELGVLVQFDPAQRTRLVAFDHLRRRHLDWADRVVETRGRDGASAAMQLIASGQGKQLFDELREALAQMDIQEVALLQRRADGECDSNDRLNVTLAVSTLFGAFFVLFAGVVIHRELGRRQRAERTIRAQNEQLELRVLERTAKLRESEARLEATVENLNEGVIVWDRAGRQLHFNRAAMTMHGLSAEADMRRMPAEFADGFELSSVDGTILPLEQWPLARIMRGETLRDAEIVICRRVGQWRRTFSYSGVLVQGEAGRPTMAVLAVRDITDRKQADIRIRAQLEHLRLLDQITRSIGERQDLKSIFQVVVNSLVDKLPVEFGCVSLLEATTQTLQVSAVSAKSAVLAQELAMAEASSFDIDRNGLSRCIQGQLVYEPDIAQVHFPFPERLTAGGLRSVVMAPLRSESVAFGVLVVARQAVGAFDSIECEFLRQLSEHVALAAHQAQLHEALQRAYDELRQTQEAAMQQERLRALGQMASGVAHDINNALSPVSLYTESLLESEQNLSERGRGYLKTIQRAVDDVAKTVARLREFYRQRERQVELAPVDVNEIVQQVFDLTRARWSDMAQSTGVAIDARLEITSDLPRILGVESEIREALTNLVFNAVDAMPDGGTLTLRTRRSRSRLDHTVAIEIVDTGVGMDEATRRRCLEPFFTTKGERGTGLGLAMVFGMVQRHSGQIEVDSVPGAGTTMRLRFAAPKGGLVASDRPILIPVETPSLRLLLVDDDPVLLKALRDALENLGHEIVTASGGQAGIDTLRAALGRGEAFAAVITDLGMPYVDGRAVAAAAKQASPAMPVIMLTGWGQRMVAEHEMPAHVDRLIAKPPKLREVCEVLAQLCGPNNAEGAT